MSNCLRCQTELVNNAKYCHICGKKIDTLNISNTDGKSEPKRTKKGQYKKTPQNNHKGSNHMIYPLTKEEEIEKISAFFLKKYCTTTNKEDKEIAYRNYFLFKFAINVGLRISDIVKLKWKDVINNNDVVTELIISKQKYLLNDKARTYIMEYSDFINNNINNLTVGDEYLFPSRQGGAIGTETINGILKNAAEMCGIKKRIGALSLRKTYIFMNVKSSLENGTTLTVDQLNSLNFRSLTQLCEYLCISPTNIDIQGNN